MRTQRGRISANGDHSMYRTITTGSLLALFAIGIIDFVNTPAFATAPINDYKKQLRQVAKANRSFQLPNALILEQAIPGWGMEYFLEKSGLLDKIADRHLKETGIYVAVERAYYDYGQYVKDNMSPSMLEAGIILEEMKPLLIDAIIRASKEVKNEQ